jgi:hypothetical protein
MMQDEVIMRNVDGCVKERGLSGLCNDVWRRTVDCIPAQRMKRDCMNQDACQGVVRGMERDGEKWKRDVGGYLPWTG